MQLTGPDAFTTRDVLNVVLSAVGVAAVIVLKAVWTEIRTLRSRSHHHGNWLLDHEYFLKTQGKPAFDRRATDADPVES